MAVNNQKRHMVPCIVAGKQVLIWGAEVFFLHQLGTMSSEQFACRDIGELNLACACEIPGSEGMDVPQALKTLDEWSSLIQQTTDRHYHQFQRDPAAFGNSEPYWRMLILTTVLQQQLGIRYDPAKIANLDWGDSRDLFIHGLLGPKRTGTCPSLPVLIAALGRRLKYPIGLVLAPGHVFSRWDDRQRGVRFNIECHGKGLVVHPDEYYHHVPVEWSPELHAEEARLGESRVFLRSLTRAEELALFLAQRGHVWESVGRWPEAHATYNTAAFLSPNNRAYRYFASEALRKVIEPSYELDQRPKWANVSLNR